MKYEYDNVDKLDSVELTLAMGCKLNCYYCPQALLLKNYFIEDKKRSTMMTFECFKHILSKVKKGGTICFSGMCEAFLNPECTDMILYAYKEGFQISLLTTLIGMSKEDIIRLKNVEFDNITLHIPDKEDNSKFNISDSYLEILELFHNTFKITSYSCHGSIHPMVEQYIDKTIFCSSTMMNRAGNLEYGIQAAPKGEIICMVGTIGRYGNWTPEILPDGTVLLCCMDYGMQHILGNILNMSVSEILNGIEYQKVQKGMRNEKINILCRKCSGAVELRKTPAYRFKELTSKYVSSSTCEVEQERILKLFRENRKLCIFGLGKWFWNNFYKHRWNEVLEIAYFCDNNEEFWGRDINGIKCISPKELYNLDEVLVMTHIKNDITVRRQLEENGIKNVVNIQDIYDMLKNRKELHNV